MNKTIFAFIHKVKLKCVVMINLVGTTTNPAFGLIYDEQKYYSSLSLPLTHTQADCEINSNV